jgi:phage baseplate assembly protein W
MQAIRFRRYGCHIENLLDREIDMEADSEMDVETDMDVENDLGMEL